ncbi:uncharacterized protein B0P05DRAFT_481599 [Gilbertella persicaria]|uniref:uncharacterized protein n=1 Tax=Gilbertella persicaria TaxID=101096 RepID=UPI0022205A06|nr:uncharacterized protein B0P05DRAFT_481599 [Gilbertella persicaria]KAI8047533.1 hypothetical protein B0P05DRAFT_481599 [Gilbertella persicaria]
MVMRMAMEIGLHEDMEEEEVNSGGEANKTWSQEYRRRLFWVIFTVDKISSAATGKPPSLLDTYCTAFLPSSDSFKSNQYYAETLDGSRYIMNNINGFRDSQLLNANSLFPDMGQDDLTDLSRRGSLSTFAYFVRVIDLLGKVTSYLNFKGKQAKELLPPSHPGSEFQQLDKALDDWYEKLPMHLKNSPANFELYKDTNQTNESRTFIMMHIAHNTLIVLLHRPSLVVADTLDSDLVQSEIKQFVTKSVEKCMAAVDNVTVLLKEIGNCRELMPPFLTYFAYTVATVIVSSSFSPRKEEAQKAKQALGIYFQLLLASDPSARGLWAMADKLYFMIRDLYAIHSNVLRRRTSMDTSSKLSPSSAPLTQPLFSQPSSFAQPPLDQQLQMPSTTLADWTQPYYLNALSNPLTNTSDQDTTSSVFQIPQGYNEPFGFSPISYGKSNDNNHHGL